MVRRIASVLVASLLLSLGVAACGDDDGGGPDARVNPDADVSQPDADVGQPDADVSQPDASQPDASQPDAMPNFDAAPLTGIALARATADGATSVMIENVLVTYKKPAIGFDVAGFFVQKVQGGPALFIAVDPTSLTPEPEVGDDVTFEITTMGTDGGGVRQAEAITGLTVNSSGNSVAGLIQDVNAATDLVSQIGDYEAELITANVTLKADPSSAGTGHMAAAVDTTGIMGNPDLRLRMPTTLQDIYGFVTDCTLTINATPMWRYMTVAQPSIWVNTDFSNATCPGALIVSAVATSTTEVVVEFNRVIDAASVTAPATQFTFTGGTGVLSATNATVNGRLVTITTTAQEAAAAYTLTVDATVLDILGGSAAGSTTFTGYEPESVCDDGLDSDGDGFFDCQDTDCAGNVTACGFAITQNLYLWELDANTPSSDVAEFIEIRNVSGTAVDLTGYFLVFVNGSDDLSYLVDGKGAIALKTATTPTLAAGDVLVVGNAGLTPDISFPDGSLQNGADGILLVRCQNCMEADFPDNLDVGTTPTFTLGIETVTKIDAIAYSNGQTPDVALQSKLMNATMTWDENANQSLQRTSLDGWSLNTPNPGSNDLQ